MNKNQEAKIKMANTVSGILTAFDTKVKNIPGLTEKHAELDALIDDSQKFSQAQLDNGIELTRKKNILRGELENATIKLSAALAAFATSSGNPEIQSLKLKYQMTDSKILKLRDLQLFALAYKIYGDALPHAALLEPFASQAEVNGLKEKADNFNEALPKKREKKGHAVLSTQSLVETIEKIDDLLRNFMDVLVKPLEHTEPEFYRSYEHARNIVEIAGRKTNLRQTQDNVKNGEELKTAGNKTAPEKTL
ncbi:MAG: hypothetical protein U0W24_08400 [Bacteroidales bacterium]